MLVVLSPIDYSNTLLPAMSPVAACDVAKAALGRSACTRLKSFPVFALNPADSFFNLTLVAIMLD